MWRLRLSNVAVLGVQLSSWAAEDQPLDRLATTRQDQQTNYISLSTITHGPQEVTQKNLRIDHHTRVISVHDFLNPNSIPSFSHQLSAKLLLILYC
jgi:hypothetical protein